VHEGGDDRPCIDRRCASLKEDAGGGDEPEAAPMNCGIRRYGGFAILLQQ
jgi:hypothetical protein